MICKLRLSTLAMCLLTSICNIAGQYFMPCADLGQGATYVGDGKCFKLYTDKSVRFFDAQGYCIQESGTLAELRTHRQRLSAVEIAQQEFSQSHAFVGRSWIGAHKPPTENWGFWLTDVETVLIPSSWWEEGQPNGTTVRGAQMCLSLLPNGQLDDFNCDNSVDFYICQKTVENPCDSFLPGSDFYDSTCYLPMEVNMTLVEAQAKCKAEGAIVAEPKSEETKDFFEAFVTDNFNLTKDQKVLIGSSKFQNGDWLWASSSEPIISPHWLNITALAPDMEDSIVVRKVVQNTLNTDGSQIWSWHVVNASEQAYFVCAKDISEECAGVFVHGSCFTMEPHYRTWSKAKNLCQNAGRRLAEPKTKALSLALDTYLVAMGEAQSEFWLGGTDAAVDGDYVWVQNSEKFSFTNWESGHDFSESENHLLWKNLKWREAGRLHTAYYVCQMEMCVTTTGYAVYLPIGHEEFREVQLSITMQTGNSTAQFAHTRISTNVLDTIFKRNVYPQRGITFKPFLGDNAPDESALSDIDGPWLFANSSAPIDLVVLIYTGVSARSALVYPAGWAVSGAYFLNIYPSNYGIGVMSTSEHPTDIDVALFGLGHVVKAELDEANIASRSYTRVSTSHQKMNKLFLVNQVSNLTKAPFVFANGPISVFASGHEERGALGYDIFEQILPASLAGSDYITFPTPLEPSHFDTFTIVAVYAGTVVTVTDPVLRIPEIYLVSPGDGYDLILPSTSFFHISGSKPFYLYSKFLISGYDSLEACTLSLLPRHLWRSSYSLQAGLKWRQFTLYVIVVVKAEHLPYLQIAGLSQIECHLVTGTDYTGCVYGLEQNGHFHSVELELADESSAMAAYVFGVQKTRRTCHQMGVPSMLGSPAYPMFDTEAYFAQLELASRLPETNESTVSCPTVTETSMVSTHSDGQDVDVTSNSPDRETTTMASAPTVDTQSGGPWQGETTQRITQGLLGSTQQYQLSTEAETTDANAETAWPTVTESIETTGSDCALPISNANLTAEELQSLLDAITSRLRVDVRETSTFRRARECAPDSRVSSVACGLLSIVLIMTTLTLIVLSDVYRLLAYCLSKEVGSNIEYREDTATVLDALEESSLE